MQNTSLTQLHTTQTKFKKVRHTFDNNAEMSFWSDEVLQDDKVLESITEAGSLFQSFIIII